jgi:hypothetical protein
MMPSRRPPAAACLAPARHHSLAPITPTQEPTSWATAEGFNMPHRWRTCFGFVDLKLETAIEFLQPGFRDTTV